VKDGTRTRDRQGHNLELYHLSYLHRRVAVGRPHSGSIGYHRRLTAGKSRRRRSRATTDDGRPGWRKIGAPAHVLNKPDRLMDSERATITQHTVIGERIVSRIDHLRQLAPIIRAAHERWDGLGYPDGLQGEAIPLESRIVFVCDAFHAMISDRPYRARMSEANALQELRVYAGT
jgi:hypothetical protein